MNIVAYGGGTNSTAMLIGLCRKQIPVDLILFSDTGGEHPHTYGYFPIINGWLVAHGMPEITRLEYRTREGLRLTLEQECLQSHSLPSIAYGYKSCSLKHKVHPQKNIAITIQPAGRRGKEGKRSTNSLDMMQEKAAGKNVLKTRSEKIKNITTNIPSLNGDGAGTIV